MDPSIGRHITKSSLSVDPDKVDIFETVDTNDDIDNF